MGRAPTRLIASRIAGAAVVDEGLLDPLLDPASQGPLALPRRDRTGGKPTSRDRPPSRIARAKWPRRRDGWAISSSSDLSGCPCSAFKLAELEVPQGVFLKSSCRKPPNFARWIGAGGVRLYASAFARKPDFAALETIVRRYLGTHALVGPRRPPRPLSHGAGCSHRNPRTLGRAGELIRLEPAGDQSTLWAERRNLEDRSPALDRVRAAARASRSPPRSSPTSWPVARHVHPARVGKGNRRSP